MIYKAMRYFLLIFLGLSVFDVSICGNPKISIITSIYKGDEFIEGFLHDITNQTIFDQCELLLINANSPGNEEQIINKYLTKFENISYLKLDADPGLYGVWNIGIQLSKGQFLTNANIDDRLAFDCYEIYLAALLQHPEIDLIYSDIYMTSIANETFLKNSAYDEIHYPEFSKEALFERPLPNNHPMWRKTLHEKSGMFDPSYKIAGDWDMWLRAALKGSQFMKVNKTLGLCYNNPKGLSTSDYPAAMSELEKMFGSLTNK